MRASLKIVAILLLLIVTDVNAQDSNCELSMDLDFWRKHLCFTKTNTPRLDYQYKPEATRVVDTCIANEKSLDTDLIDCQLKQNYQERTCRALNENEPDKIDQCINEGFVTAPRAVVAIAPQGPKSKKACEGGTVTVGFEVLENGTVNKPKVVNANPPKIFNRAALSAIRKYRFAPQKRNYDPEPSQFTWDFQFPPLDSESCEKQRNQ